MEETAPDRKPGPRLSLYLPATLGALNRSFQRSVLRLRVNLAADSPGIANWCRRRICRLMDCRNGLSSRLSFRARPIPSSKLMWRLQRTQKTVTYSPDRSDIVADGPDRVRQGSARRLKARLTRRTASLSKGASFLGRVVIRFRIWCFVRRLAARRVPSLETLYSTPTISN